jgi:integrase
MVTPEGIGMKKRITHAVVENAKPTGKRYEIWDTAVPGFGLRVGTSGVKTWMLLFRVKKERKQRRETIGRAGVMDLAEAHEKARAILAEANAGRAPVDITTRKAEAEREKAEAEAETFEAVARRFLARARRKDGTPLRAATLAGYERGLLLQSSGLHHLAMPEIKRRHIAETLGTIETQHGIVSAARARAALHRLFQWAMAQDERIEANPVSATEGYVFQAQARRWTDDELAALWRATAEKHDFNMMIRLALLTGCRKSEIGGARWSEIDLEAGVWLIPAARMKSRHEHAVALPRQAIAMLEALPRATERDLLFGRGAKGFNSGGHPIRRLHARLGSAVGDFTFHDLRDAVRSGLDHFGIAHDVKEAVLAHVPTKLVRTYSAGAPLEAKRRALQAWADRLDAIVGNAAATNVVALGR